MLLCLHDFAKLLMLASLHGFANSLLHCLAGSRHLLQHTTSQGTCFQPWSIHAWGCALPCSETAVCSWNACCLILICYHLAGLSCCCIAKVMHTCCLLQRCVDYPLLQELLVNCMVGPLCPLQTLPSPPTEAVSFAGRVFWP